MRNHNSTDLPEQSASSSSSAPQPSGGPINDPSDGVPATTTKKSGLGANIMIALCALVLLAGVGVLLYPTVADWWNRQHSSRAVATYVEQVKNMDDGRKNELIAQAHAYNEQLNSVQDRWHLTDAEREQYNNTLDVTGTGIMGYITIPELKVRLPIYHGTEETVLQIAGGHLEGSSLPVGGKGTHTAISGHTGLPSAKLFTGLDSLKEGDTFAFHVLDDTYTYKVDQIRVVLPHEMRDLDFDANQDYATLITCTPYGVNSHRLLVRGHRIPNPVEADETAYEEADKQQTIVIAIAALLILVFIILIVRSIVRRSRRGNTHVKHAKR